ncbi:MAG TPA: hypothetical protein VGM88_28740 [Kofleriaceae bacterium]|jgi:hypothetical protein
MPKAPKGIDAKLAALSALRSRASLDAADLALVVAALDSEIGVLVSSAVGLVKQFELTDLYPRLAPAFTRLCPDGPKRDPLCRAKFAIAELLHDLERWEDEVFPVGVRLVQNEPAYPLPLDAAGPLRGICGIAYAHFSIPEALDVLAELLADPLAAARQGAAQGLADSRRTGATAVLRLKLALGDRDPDVLSACAGALLDLAGDDGLASCERLLGEHDQRAEVVALAIGSSRLPAAVPILRRWAEAAGGPQRTRVGFLALALLRVDESTDYLFERVADASPAEAIAAAKALATFKADPALAARLREAAAPRDKATWAAIVNLLS